MVAKFLDVNKPKTSLTWWKPHRFKLHRSYSVSFVKCWWNFLGLNPKGAFLSLGKEKENFCFVFTQSIKGAREIRMFHVAIVQRRLRNVQKAWCTFKVVLLILTLLLFCRSRCRRCRRCLSSSLLLSRNFATMVTWRHTFPLLFH